MSEKFDDNNILQEILDKKILQKVIRQDQDDKLISPNNVNRKRNYSRDIRFKQRKSYR